MSEVWPIEKLKGWDKNPRDIKPDDFERLKRQIKKLGIYKPLLVNKDGVVLGGNMRLKAYKELGLKEVEVSIVDAQDEAKMLEYALSDNDRAGYYETVDLMELLNSFKDEIEMGDYKVDLGESAELQTLIDSFDQIINDPELEWTDMPEFKQNNLGGFKQIIVAFANEDDMNNFSTLVGQKITTKTRSIWFPPQETESRIDKVYTD